MRPSSARSPQRAAQQRYELHRPQLRSSDAAQQVDPFSLLAVFGNATTAATPSYHPLLSPSPNPSHVHRLRHLNQATRRRLMLLQQPNVPSLSDVLAEAEFDTTPPSSATGGGTLQPFSYKLSTADQVLGIGGVGARFSARKAARPVSAMPWDTPAAASPTTRTGRPALSVPPYSAAKAGSAASSPLVDLHDASALSPDRNGNGSSNSNALAFRVDWQRELRQAAEVGSRASSPATAAGFDVHSPSKQQQQDAHDFDEQQMDIVYAQEQREQLREQILAELQQQHQQQQQPVATVTASTASSVSVTPSASSSLHASTSPLFEEQKESMPTSPVSSRAHLQQQQHMHLPPQSPPRSKRSSARSSMRSVVRASHASLNQQGSNDDNSASVTVLEAANSILENADEIVIVTAAADADAAHVIPDAPPLFSLAGTPPLLPPELEEQRATVRQSPSYQATVAALFCISPPARSVLLLPASPKTSAASKLRKTCLPVVEVITAAPRYELFNLRPATARRQHRQQQEEKQQQKRNNDTLMSL